jgi:hypothetical protein
MALETAVWGPSVEVRDGSVPPELMQMYLTLKAEKRPEVVLGVAEDAAAEQIMQAYARRAGMVASIDAGASEHLRCRAAELAQRFDDALDALLPGSDGRASLPPPAASDAAALAPPNAGPARASQPPEVERAAGRDSREPSQANLTTARPGTRAAPRSDPPRTEALAGKVDALLRAGNWRALLDALDAHAATSPLPFTLQLARAIAQRELEGRRRGRHWPWIAALVAGIALGYALRHYDLLPSAALPF